MYWQHRQPWGRSDGRISTSPLASGTVIGALPEVQFGRHFPRRQDNSAILLWQNKERQFPKRLTKDRVFKPTLSRTEKKADITNRTARAILDDENAKRREKIAKLRAARLEMETQKE